MATVEAVYGVFDAFCGQLQEILPKRSKRIVQLRAEMKTAATAPRPKAGIERVMNELVGCEALVMQRDAALFVALDEKDVFGTFRLGHYWTRFTKETQDAIWQYVQSLFMLGTGLVRMSDVQLDKIEGFAKRCAGKMQGMQKQDGKTPDMRELQRFMMGEMGTMLRDMDLGAGLAGAAPEDQPDFDRAEFTKFMQQNSALSAGMDLDSSEFQSMLDEIEGLQQRQKEAATKQVAEETPLLAEQGAPADALADQSTLPPPPAKVGVA